MTTLAIYVDAHMTERDGRVYVDEAAYGYLKFACAVGENGESVRLFGRDGAEKQGLIELSTSASVWPVANYGSLRDLRNVIKAVPATMRSMNKALVGVDVVWIHGPNPFSFLLALAAIKQKKRIVLGVRQDTMNYFKARLPNPKWTPVLAIAKIMDVGFKQLARRHSVTAVGNSIATDYGAPNSNVLDMVVTLTDHIVDPQTRIARTFGRPVSLLSVGRLAQEKVPLLLIEVLAELHSTNPGGYKLTWVGTGPLIDDVRQRARDLGVSDFVELPGFVPHGPQLLEQYHTADIFVHTALTEGLPQVIAEAAAACLPMVATDVGSVSSATNHGTAALLVQPNNKAELVRAIRTVSENSETRERLIYGADAINQSRNMNSESQKVANFIMGKKAAITPQEQPA